MCAYDRDGNCRYYEMDSFLLTGETAKSYSHQFANIYFARLTVLKPVVLKAAENKWKGVTGKWQNLALNCHFVRQLALLDLGNPAPVPRVLDVVKSRLCYVIGTVYLDMPLKPNVLVDIGKEVSSDLASSRPSE
jgi:DNA polymerase delta subunit 2